MTTFSQIVDAMVFESKRFDLRAEICAYVNQSVREVHFRSDTGSILFYLSNLKELALVTTVDSGFGWDMPNPAVFQAMQAVQYPDVWDRDSQGYGQWARESIPGRNLNANQYFFYRMGNRFVFGGYGAAQSRINIAYYEYPRDLKYYKPEERPATWDDAEGWKYLPAYDVDETTRELARNLVSNWLLQRWHLVLEEGIRAKIYKRVSDEVRGRTAYSLYSTLRQGLWTSEVADLGGPL